MCLCYFYAYKNRSQWATVFEFIAMVARTLSEDGARPVNNGRISFERQSAFRSNETTVDGMRYDRGSGESLGKVTSSHYHRIWITDILVAYLISTLRNALNIFTLRTRNRYAIRILIRSSDGDDGSGGGGSLPFTTTSRRGKSRRPI